MDEERVFQEGAVPDDTPLVMEPSPAPSPAPPLRAASLAALSSELPPPPLPFPPPVATAYADDGEYESEDDFSVVELDFASAQILSVIKPVTLCLMLVIAIVRTIANSEESPQRFAALAYNEDANTDDSAAMKLGGALLNAAIFVGIITVTTTIFVLLYKYNCMRVIYGWLFTSTTMMLGMVGAYIFLRLLQVYNRALDSISFLVIVINFAVVGLLSIFWRSPLLLQQAYLIVASSFLGTMFFTMLPVWTTWVLLAAVAVYDILAVLCPKGPLRVLVETAQSRPEQPLPGLLYSAGVAYTVSLATGLMASPGGSDDDGVPLTGMSHASAGGEVAIAPAPQTGAASPLERRAGRGLKLGLGDFIFYSVLVAHSAVNDWIAVFTTTAALITGLLLTLFCLALYKHALPALPFSIALGIASYFGTRFVLSPYCLTLSLNAVYV